MTHRIRPPFFQYNKRLLRQKTGGACLYMPQDGHCLASFEVIPPPKKLVFPRPKKCEISPLKTGCARALLKKKYQTHFFSSSFSAVFVGNSVTPMSTLANNKRSCSKKWKKSGQNCVFPVFPAKILARFCHAVLDFREHQGLPPDEFDHARSIAMPGTTVKR